MHSYFTADRRHRLRQGQRLELRHSPAQMPHDIRAHSVNLFPEGLSDHGERYWINGKANEKEHAIELVWEYVRRAHYPERPSRLTATFAWRSIAEAHSFAAKFGDADVRVWELSAQESFAGNMSLLNNSSSLARTSQLAHDYWQGRSGPEIAGLAPPAWEILLSGPITVIRQVE
jgi:hypothetical protein